MKEFIDKLIERLEEYPTYSFGVSLLNTEEYIKVSDVKEIINQLAEEYKGEHDDTDYANIELYAFWKNHQWIPCSEKLPDTEHISGVSESVLVTTNFHSIFTAEYHRNGKWLDDVADWSLDVIAWMPLPAPYTEGE